MIDNRQKIIEYMSRPGYTGADFKTIIEALSFSHEVGTKLLAQLETEAVIFKSVNKGLYLLTSNFNLVKAEIIKVTKHFAIARVYDDEMNMNEYKIDNRDIKDAYYKDIVLLTLIDNRSARVFKVITRGSEFVVGEYISNKTEFVVPDDDNLPDKIRIYKGRNLKAVNGHKVVIKVVEYKHELSGEIIKIIGHKNDPRVDVLSVAYKHRAPVEFPENVMSEALAKNEPVALKDIKNRLDLRDKLIVTIDGADAKDLDDAISLDILENGNYQVGVHIADVSYYVEKNSNIDKEAFKRGTSIYMADYVIPMLPHALSNGICSLNPNVDRLTLSCIAEVDHNGEVINYEIKETVINSKYRLTYDQVNDLFENKISINKEVDALLYETLKLSRILNKVKVERGMIELDVKESKIITDKNGKVIDIKVRTQRQAEQLIEDLMILANEITATHVFWQKLPYIYRIHDQPELKNLERLSRMIETMGYRLTNYKKGIHPKAFQDLLNRAKGKPQADVISTLMLRSFAKARYDTENIGHFGLGSDCYSHFTSPIRRYPDLASHRLLKLYANTGKYNIDELYVDSSQTAFTSSLYERRAVEIERDVEAIKKAEYMEDKVGKIYDGVVSGIINSGFFVELANTVEGMVRFDGMDDYFEFDSYTMSAHGRGSKQIIKLGDKVKVKVISASKVLAQVEFAYIKATKNK
jgi:ribonuclease R